MYARRLSIGLGALLLTSPALGSLVLPHSQSVSSSSDLFSLTNTGTGGAAFFKAAGTTQEAVFGWANSTTGANTGVFGQTSSTSGRGVLGKATATTGTCYGVRGESVSTSGRGVFGQVTTTTGACYGVRGDAASSGGFGVYGRNTAGSGATGGVRGETTRRTTRMHAAGRRRARRRNTIHAAWLTSVVGHAVRILFGWDGRLARRMGRARRPSHPNVHKLRRPSHP
ncbi:hypothetical protein RAS1_18690 [Phycisphaerae bacterium RAS1]|nr:hypothetical protein RAS1_18690 [Phycisphaerae bacterium RAS1]